MQFGIRGSMIALAAAATCLGPASARAGDDGAAPLWVGIGSIFGPLVGMAPEEEKPISYQEHGKLVVPKALDLPPPGNASVTTGGAWPVNQEALRKKVAKENEKKKMAGAAVGDVRVRGTQPFPNAPVTVRASDQAGSATEQAGGAKAKTESSSLLGGLNPLGWVGLGKDSTTSAPGQEPDRDWLTDPPKGYRSPVTAGTSSAAAAKRPQPAVNQ